VSGRRTVDARRWLHCSVAIALSLAGAGCGAATDSGIPLAQKRSWEKSFNHGDSRTVAALYANDAELVMSGTAPVHGREAIRAEVEKMIRSGVKLRIGTDRAEAAGNLAYFYGPYTVSSNQGVVERGAYLEVWRRTAGRWQIELDVNATGAPVNPIPQH
jgi:ketosteroid isomerase-like protein